MESCRIHHESVWWRGGITVLINHGARWRRVVSPTLCTPGRGGPIPVYCEPGWATAQVHRFWSGEKSVIPAEHLGCSWSLGSLTVLAAGHSAD
jgi:hypothetical protein